MFLQREIETKHREAGTQACACRSDIFLRPEQNTKHREAGTQAGACAAPMFLQREIETKHREASTLYTRRSDVDNLNKKQNTEMPAHRLRQRVTQLTPVHTLHLTRSCWHVFARLTTSKHKQ